jgi:hypothetical protein
MPACAAFSGHDTHSQLNRYTEWQSAITQVRHRFIPFGASHSETLAGRSHRHFCSMWTRIAPAPVPQPMRSASSAGRARRTDYIGRQPRARKKARSANWSLMSRQRDMAWGPDVRILTRHGSIAAGGEVDYIVRGKMIGGWLPGRVRQSRGDDFCRRLLRYHFRKDLGERTARIAERMTAFRPKPGKGECHRTDALTSSGCPTVKQSKPAGPATAGSDTVRRRILK